MLVGFVKTSRANRGAAPAQQRTPVTAELRACRALYATRAVASIRRKCHPATTRFWVGTQIMGAVTQVEAGDA